jgi:uncharacterized membrane protein
MNKLAEFSKTTLIGGFLILLPIYLSVLLLLKTLKGVLALISPVTAQIPAAVAFKEVLAALIVLAACFVAGLLVRTGPIARGVTAVERNMLEKIPGYSLMRGLASRIGGRDDAGTFEPALVEIEDALAPAMIIERLPDGRFTVLVPSVPTPAAGALYVLTADRVHPVDVPLHKLLKVYSKWGEGMAELVAAARIAPRIG